MTVVNVEEDDGRLRLLKHGGVEGNSFHVLIFRVNIFR